MKTSSLESLFNNVADLKDWNFIKQRLWHRYFPVNFLQFFKKPHLQNTSGWLLLLIPPFLTKVVSSDFSFSFSFIIDNCDYWKVSKNEDLFKTIVFYFLHKRHIKENTDFLWQKPRQLSSAEANFEGCGLGAQLGFGIQPRYEDPYLLVESRLKGSD